MPARRSVAVTEVIMPAALLVLIGCQLIGEMLRDALHLPIPGPVIGMVLLTAFLASRDRASKPGDDLASSSLQRTSDALITHMGLLFVPAGAGVIAESDLLRSQWFPIMAGLIGSTVLGLGVTGLVMHWTSRVTEGRRVAAPAGQANLEVQS
jgi:holin-like protein